MVVVGGIDLYIQSPVLFGIASIVIPLYIVAVWSFNKPLIKFLLYGGGFVFVFTLLINSLIKFFIKCNKKN